MDQSPAARALVVAVQWVFSKWTLITAAKTGATEIVAHLLDRGFPADTEDDKGISLLHWAAEGGHVTTMRLLMRRGGNVDSVDASGLTPLHSAAASGQTKAVRELIGNGAAKVVDVDVFGTPLHLAALMGQVETVVAMLEEGCLCDVVDSNGSTVLHFAAEGGHVELVKELVDRGCDVDAEDWDGHTPLHSAAVCDRTEAVRELIRKGASKSVLAGETGTPLHQAAGKGYVKTIVAMLEEGCPFDVVDSNGSTVLHWAAEGGHVDTVKVLVDRGCELNALDVEGCTPLHDAADSGEKETVCELIKRGAMKSVVAGKLGTPLHRAACEGHLETVVAMLEGGCPIAVLDSVGHTVLHWAAEGGHVEVVKELVGRGCNVNALDADGCTPLHDAVAGGEAEAIHELIKHGATRAVVAGRYGTPLHQAVANGHLETVEALLVYNICEADLTNSDVTKANLSCGGIIGTCNSLKQSPVMWAARYGQVEVFKLLTSKGGVVCAKDSQSLSTFEHCLIGGHANKLSQFCEACGIKSSGEELRGALETLLTQGLVNASKVLCLCAFSGDSAFLENEFIVLVTSDTCAMPAAVKCVKYHFCEGEGVPFIDELHMQDENTLNPLHISLLSMKSCQMGFAGGGIQHATKNHYSFITKLLSHPVLKKTVNENFPNGLSPLDLARQFELREIAELIEGAGGRQGVWADIPQEIKNEYPSAIPAFMKAYASIMAINMDGRHSLEDIRSVFSSVLWHQPLWHPNAAIIDGDVGAESDDHEYKSLLCDVNGESKPLNTLRDLRDRLKKTTYIHAINAMLNHPTGGSIHFGIGDDGIVEQGLDLKDTQNYAIEQLRKDVGNILDSFSPKVNSAFARVEPINLWDDKYTETGRWRFDIIVKPHLKGVKVGGHAYHRVGPQTKCMTDQQFALEFMPLVKTVSSSQKSQAKLKRAGDSSGKHLQSMDRPRDDSRMLHRNSQKGQDKKKKKNRR